MKTFLKLLLLLGVTAYIAVVFTRINSWGDTTLCSTLNIVMEDSAGNGFITPEEAARLLTKAGQNPIGKEMDEISGKEIEQVLLRNSYIEKAKCYKSPGGCVNVHIAQRLPILRIKAHNGEDYYIDKRGNVLQTEGFSSDLIVATGSIDKQYISSTLLPLASHLNANPFAEKLVLQVNVDKDKKVTLVPRIGCEIIHLGVIDTTSVAQQMQHLQTFYENVLPEVGMNTYRELDLEYADQIVCKKYK